MKWIGLVVLFSAAYVTADSWVAINVLSKYHPQAVRIETRTRDFMFDASNPKSFEFEAPLIDTIKVTVNGNTTRFYRGKLRLEWAGDEFKITNTTPLEYYVAGVVVGEIGVQAHPELMKAQAIIARTYAINKSRNTVLSDLAYHQVFKGFDHFAMKVYATTSDTAQQILMRKGQAADLLFHAECGSKIYSAGEFWGSEQVFEPIALPDDAPLGERWRVKMTTDQLKQVFQSFMGARKLDTRPVQIEVSMRDSVLTYYAEDFRLRINRIHGWNTLPSNEYTLEATHDGWIFQGRGRGHLVGLCQQQALFLARHGWSAKNLLNYFYPNLSFGRYQDKNL